MLNQITQIRLPDGQVVALVDWTDKPLFGSCDLGSGYTNEIVDLFQVSVGRPVPSAASAAGGPITPRQNTLADTNISTQGGLSSTEEFLIYSMKPEVQEFIFDPNDFTTRTSVGTNAAGNPATPFMPQPSLSCLAQLNAALLLEIEISLKIYSQAGFGWFNTGFGPTSGFSLGAAAPGPAGFNGTPANQGHPGQSAVRTLVVPMHIGGQENFRVRLRNPTAQPVNFGVDEDFAGPTVPTQPNPPPPGQVTPYRMATVRVYLDGLYKRPTS